LRLSQRRYGMLWNARGRTKPRRKSEDRVAFALEARGGVGTWDLDVTSDRLYCNVRFAELFSVEPERAASGPSMSEFMLGIHAGDRFGVAEKGQSKLVATTQRNIASF
jgi:PAS domain-containing protein